MDKAALRRQTVETLGLLVERYPNLRVAQIISSASTGYGPDLYCMDDTELARGLNQLFISFTQLEAAGIMKHG